MQGKIVNINRLANWADIKHQQRAINLQEKIPRRGRKEDGSWTKGEEQAVVEAKKGTWYVI